MEQSVISDNGTDSCGRIEPTDESGNDRGRSERSGEVAECLEKLLI